jgi:hypothetical protein
MSFDPITAGIDLLSKVIDRVLPNKVEADKAKAELLVMQTKGELDQLVGQLDINKIEAGHQSVFVAGWRPFIGWICGCALAYAALLEPLMRFTAEVLFKYTGGFPVINTDITLQVLLGILGLGAYRTYERVQGVIPPQR